MRRNQGLHAEIKRKGGKSRSGALVGSRRCEFCSAKSPPSSFRSASERGRGEARPLSVGDLQVWLSSIRGNKRGPIATPKRSIQRGRGDGENGEREGGRAEGISLFPSLSSPPYSRHYDHLGSTFQSTSSEVARSSPPQITVPDSILDFIFNHDRVRREECTVICSISGRGDNAYDLYVSPTD